MVFSNQDGALRERAVFVNEVYAIELMGSVPNEEISEFVQVLLDRRLLRIIEKFVVAAIGQPGNISLGAQYRTSCGCFPDLPSSEAYGGRQYLLPWCVWSLPR